MAISYDVRPYIGEGDAYPIGPLGYKLTSEVLLDLIYY